MKRFAIAFVALTLSAGCASTTADEGTDKRNEGDSSKDEASPPPITVDVDTTNPKGYGPDECFRDCMGGHLTYNWMRFCLVAC